MPNRQPSDSIHIVRLAIRGHLFLQFWLVDTWTFAHPRDHRAVARLENVRQLNIRRGKKLSFQLSHRQPVWSNILFFFITPSIVSTEQLFPNQLLFRVFSIWKCYSDVVLFWNAFWLVDLHRQKIYPYIWCLVNNSEWKYKNMRKLKHSTILSGI